MFFTSKYSKYACTSNFLHKDLSVFKIISSGKVTINRITGLKAISNFRLLIYISIFFPSKNKLIYTSISKRELPYFTVPLSALGIIFFFNLCQFGYSSFNLHFRLLLRLDIVIYVYYPLTFLF